MKWDKDVKIVYMSLLKYVLLLYLFHHLKSIKNTDQIFLYFKILSDKLVKLTKEAKNK